MWHYPSKITGSWASSDGGIGVAASATCGGDDENAESQNEIRQSLPALWEAVKAKE